MSLLIVVLGYVTAVLKCNGKDIVKKGHRKNKYLFAFPGLVAPVAGGKFGDLTQLDSKNPILYVDFPQACCILHSNNQLYDFSKYLSCTLNPNLSICHLQFSFVLPWDIKIASSCMCKIWFCHLLKFWRIMLLTMVLSHRWSSCKYCAWDGVCNGFREGSNCSVLLCTPKTNTSR